MMKDIAKEEIVQTCINNILSLRNKSKLKKKMIIEILLKFQAFTKIQNIGLSD